MQRARKTPPFLGPDGEVVPGSIAEAGHLPLGGIDQWVMIRGENVANPILLVLHGGPGFSDTGFLRHYVPELEKSFTVVYWDQRGTGRSYRPTIPRSSMTVAQLLADLDQLVDHVRRRLGKDKVTILGHSWGSILGVLYAARRPDVVAAYVGVAQIGSWPAAEAASYAQAVADAGRQGNHAVLARLRAIGPPPYGADQVFVERTCAMRLQVEPTPRALWDAARVVVAGYLGAPESSLLEVRAALRGFHFSMACLWPEVSRLDLLQAVPALEVPFVCVLGRRDPWIPAGTSVAYVDALRAPSKQLVWFDESGHEPFVDEPARFVAVMLEVVRPLCGPAPEVRHAAPTRLPGDELLPAARAEATHHIDIQAPPEKVWPWLVQMGRRRAGWYSWDLLDNGGVPSADRIVPELQTIAVGDVLPVKATGAEGFTVLVVDPPRALVLGDASLLAGRAPPASHAPRATWAFVLEPLGPAATRLRVRVRAEYEPSLATSLLRPLVGVVHDVMERKQLRTLKQRVEAHASAA